MDSDRSVEKEVGLWIYQLCCILSCGLLLLIHFKTHSHMPTLGEKLLTDVVMG
jgi:hypothetical protein